MSDLISRKAAIDAIRVYMNGYKKHIGKPDDSEVFAHARGLIVSIESSIYALPPAEPERKEGCWMTEVYEYGDGEEVADRWVEREAQRGDVAYCSVCKGVAGLDGSEEYSLTQFCPHCGVKMKNAEE